MAEKFKLVLEFNIEARCIVHGTREIRMQARTGKAGPGQVFVEMGQAHCRGPGCSGTSQWITLETVPTKWESVSEEQWRAAMKHSLEAEMGQLKTELDPEEEEEVTQPEVRRIPPVPATPGGVRVIARPALGNGGVPARTQPTDVGGGEPA